MSKSRTDVELPLLITNSTDLRDSRYRSPAGGSRLSESFIDDPASGSTLPSIEINNWPVKSHVHQRRKSIHKEHELPGFKCSSVYRQYLWTENKLQKHVERILNAKPQVDDVYLPPIGVSQMCVSNRSKEMAATSERIAIENQRLVKRLAKTLTTRSGRVDCWRDSTEQRSLRSDSRIDQRKRIVKENLHLLERIAKVPPSYETSRQQLMKDYEQHLRFRDNLRRFPRLPTRTVYPKQPANHESESLNQNLILPQLY